MIDAIELGRHRRVDRCAATRIGSSATAISVARSVGALEQPLPGAPAPTAGCPTAEDVGARVDRLAARLLGRHVRELALEQARLRLRGAERARRLGDAEVDQLDRAVVGDEHVLRRDVAVHEAERLAVGADARVRVVQPGQRVGDDAAGEPERRARLPLLGRFANERAQVLAVDELHGDEVLLVELAEVEDLDDVRMVEARRDARLVEEHLDEAWRRAESCGRMRLTTTSFSKPSTPGLAAEEDLGHAAFGELALEHVFAELAIASPGTCGHT